LEFLPHRPELAQRLVVKSQAFPAQNCRYDNLIR
jgi:hypothetical protein